MSRAVRNGIVPTMRTWAALGFAVGYGLLRLSWTLGVRWGYSACDPADSPGADDLRTGCAAETASLPFHQGWGAVALCALLVAAAVLTRTRPARTATVAAWTACGALVTAAFPLHLVFEIPTGLAGRPTDWLGIGHRLVLVAGGLLFAAAAAEVAHRRGRPVDDGPRPVPRWVRAWAYGGVAVPLLGWTVPHGLWMIGVPFGIPVSVITDARSTIDPLLAAALALVPGLASLLTLGLAHRWGQQVPAWVPVLAGRRVPRMLALVPAGAVAAALVTYGVLSTATLLLALASGAVTPAGVASSWAVTATLLVFLAWGVALGVTTVGYGLVTRPRYPSAQVSPSR